MVRALLLLGLVACQTPGTKIVYEISSDSDQSCGTSSCSDVGIPCDAVVSIRILRPEDPAAPLVTICEPLPKNAHNDLCALSSIDLAAAPLELPKETLEVQMLIWSRDQVEIEGTGTFDCAKNEVLFDARGLPLSQTPTPAIGGHAYYHPGDEEVHVMLGCTNIDDLRSCNTNTTVEVTSTVQSFENIGVFLADSNLNVAVGEPELRGAASVWSLESQDLVPLVLTMVTGSVGIWQGTVQRDNLVERACTQVLEDTAQATATVQCTDDGIPPDNELTINLPGTLLPKASLDQILTALGLLAFPENGMTIGIVVDGAGNPRANEVVSAPGVGTIKYLNATRTGVGGTMTSSSGVFVSTDAEFPTKFSVPGSPEYLGGQIKEKVTLVVIVKPQPQ
jgi:hypothetical protein